MKIISNGSKWAGEKPDNVKVLLELLSREPLDHRFKGEKYGNHFYRTGVDKFTAFGNFLNVSHVFNIEGTVKEMKTLRSAICKNHCSEAYRKSCQEAAQ